MAQVKETAVVYSQEALAPDIFSMWIVTEAAKEAGPGQFINVYSRDGSRILPRPISICETAHRLPRSRRGNKGILAV